MVYVKMNGMVRGVMALAVVAGLMPFGVAGAFADEMTSALVADDAKAVAAEVVAGEAKGKQAFADDAAEGETEGAATADGTIGDAATKAADKAAAPSATGEVQGNGWKLDANGVLTLTVDVADRDPGLGQGPYEWDAYKDKIKEVRVAEGVTRIPVVAFANYPNLQKATMSSTVKQIMGGAFSGCANLTEAILNDGLEMVSVGAFSSSGLTSINLPSGVEWYSDVFTYCKNLTGTLVVPADFTFSGNAMFYGTGVETVIFEEGFKEVPNQFLSGCENLKYVYAPESLTVHQGTLDDGTVYFDSPIPACTIIGYKGTFAERYVEHWQKLDPDWAAGMNFHAIDGDEHAYGAWTIIEPASCESAGLQKRTCEICGAEETKAVAEAAGHAWDEGTVTKEATETAEGVKEFHCIRCGATKTEAIAKLSVKKPEAKPGTENADGTLPQTGDPMLALAGMTAIASAGAFAAALHLKKRQQ